MTRLNLEAHTPRPRYWLMRTCRAPHMIFSLACFFRLARDGVRADRHVSQGIADLHQSATYNGSTAPIPSPVFWRPQRLHDQHQCGRGTSTGVVSVVAGKRCRPLVKYRHQPTLRNVFLDSIEGQPCQTVPGQRCGDDQFGTSVRPLRWEQRCAWSG